MSSGVTGMLAPGWHRFVLPPAVLGAITAPVCKPASALFLAAAGFLAFFFRNPDREPPSDPRLMVSAADGRLLGRVMHVGPGDEEVESYLDEPVMVSVFMSPLDVHVNRAPFDGVVREVNRVRGRTVPAFRSSSATENHRAILLFEGRVPFLVRLVVGAVARRIDLYVEEGDRVRRGQPIGMIRLGSRVDVAVPRAHVDRVLVSVGDRVRAGETPIIRVKEGRRSGRADREVEDHQPA